ncbi:MAG: DNA alkylation repair protein [Dehalococcoidia bacterium]|nr:DNA alkylation repair protein [Dehalococcoidia bacterium]
MPVSVESILASLQQAEQPLRTPAMRSIAMAAAKELRQSRADAESVFTLCDDLIELDELHDAARTVAFEIAYRHRGLRDALDVQKLERLGRTLDGWASVDHFARKLSGPAWQRNQISDEHVLAWTRSEGFWWQRVGLVSTIALNERHLGKGDAARTLAICELFIDDRRDLHVKALSWALRELGQRDPVPVQEFIEQHRDRLASKIIREVQNKLTTGHKMAKPSEAMQRRMQARART